MNAQIGFYTIVFDVEYLILQIEWMYDVSARADERGKKN